MRLKIIPYPSGKEFAITFVDDTDNSTIENTKPVYEYLHAMGMKGTKTIWTMRKTRSSIFNKKSETNIVLDDKSGMTIEDTDYLKFVLELKEKGFEIALHGVSAGNSYRTEIEHGIERFKKRFGEYPKINSFHEKNIENLYAGSLKLDIGLFKLFERVTDKSEYEGTKEGSPYFWGDIAFKRIKYMRLPFHNISEINTLKINPSMPFYDPKRPYVRFWFSNSDGSNCKRYLSLLSKKNIQKLKNENGACLIYTHFAKGFVQKKNKQYRLNSKFYQVVNYLEKQKNAWFPNVSELLDRLSLIKNVTLKHEGYDVYIKNDNEQDIFDLTIVCNDQCLYDTVDKRNINAEDGKILIKKIPAKGIMQYKSTRKGNYHIQRNKDKSIRLERKKIELYNYIGLIKQRIGEAVLK